MMSHLFRVGILASLCLGALPESASAQRAYDGQWSVLIVTQRGNCGERTYRYGVTITNGGVYYSGGGASFSGRVSGNGAVSVRVSAGGASASGSGRLSRNSGRGSWSGQAGSDRCSGYWTAQRRG